MADYTEQERLELAQRVNEEMRLYGQLHASTAAQVRDASVGIKGFTEKTTGAGASVGKAFGELAKSTYAGKQGLSEFNGVIEATTAAMGVMLAMLGGPIWGTIALGLTAFGKALGMANKMSQQTFEAYKQLADVGGSAGASLQGLRNQARDFDYTLGEGDEGLKDFVAMISKNSQTLAYFKGTVAQGTAAAAGIGDAFSQYRDPLLKLGLTTEDQNQSIMNYINYSSKLGMSQGKTYDQLAASARKYIVETEALAAITGKSREEIEAQRQAALGEQQYRAKIEQMKREGDVEGVKRMTTFNDALSSLEPDVAKGMRQMAVSGLQTAEAQALNRLTNGEALEIQQQLNEGKINEAQALTRLQRAVKEGLPTWETLAQQNVDLAGVTGNLAKRYDFAAMNAGDIGNALNEGRKAVDATTKSKEKELNDNVNTIRNQKEAAKSLQGVIEKFISVATSLTNGLSKLWKSIAGTMLDVSDAIEDVIDYIKYNILKMDKPTYDKDLAATLKEQQESLKNSLADFKKTGKMNISGEDEALRYQGKEGKALYEQDKLAQLAKLKEQERVNEAKRGLEDQKAARRKSLREKFYGDTEGKGVAPEAAPGAPARKGYSAHSNQSLSDLGLTLVGKGGAEGDRQREGAQVSDKLVELAQKIKSNVPGWAGFTSFNDDYHKDKEDSVHNRGRALDFVLNKKPSREEGQKLVDMLKNMGASGARDEYNDPSSGATGGHIHASVPEGRYGGIFEGPKTGYAAVMHGREAILPLPNGESIPIAIDTGKIIESFSEALSRTSSSSAGSSSGGNDLLSALLDMVRLQRDQNDLVSKLLQVQRA
jgi:hypothetical protein